MNIYGLLSIIGITIYLLCIIVLYIYSRKETVSYKIVTVHELLQYVCLSSLSFSFVSSLLYIQETGIGYPIGTHSSSGFITDLMFLSFIFVIVLVYNLRIVRNFCQPIYTYNVIDKLHKFFLYLRPFKTDQDNFKRIIKRFSKVSFPAVSIANPRTVVQNIESDKIFTDDTEWKSAVHKCMEKSQFIILNIGDTDGCLWEMEECSISHLGKTIFGVSSKYAFEVFEKFLIGKELNAILPPYVDGTIQLYFLKEPLNHSLWDTISVNTKSEIQRAFELFCENRQDLIDEINLIKDGKSHPFRSLFDDKYFPEDFGWLSLSGLSMLSFPFMGRLLPIYWIVYISFAIFLCVLTPTYGPIIMGIILTIFGKRMIWLSSKWTGKHSINSQINIIAIVTLICTIFSFILGSVYLSHNPIEPKSYTYNYSNNIQSQLDITSTPEYYQELVKNCVQIENRSLPQVSGSGGVTAESITYESCMVTYYYTVHNENGNYISEDMVPNIKKEMISELLNNPSSKQFVTYCIKGNVSLVYKYKNSITGNVLTMSISPLDFKQAQCHI